LQRISIFDKVKIGVIFRIKLKLKKIDGILPEVLPNKKLAEGV